MCGNVDFATVDYLFVFFYRSCSMHIIHCGARSWRNSPAFPLPPLASLRSKLC